MKKNRKLKEKLHSPMALVGFSSLAIFAFLAFLLIRQQIESSIKDQASTALQVFSSSIHEDILNGLDTEVYRKCLTLKENGLVSEVKVIGLDERLICNEKKETFTSAFSLSENIFFNPNDKEVAGRIKIGFQNQIISTILKEIVVLLGVTLIFLALLYLALSHLILGSETRKLESLAEMLKRSDIDELGKSRSILEENDSVELLHLCEGVERLTTNWYSYQEELIRNETLKAINKSSRLLAHDIKSPLGAIKTGLMLIEEKPEKALALATKGLSRIDSMLSDILERNEEYALKFEAKKIEIKHFFLDLKKELLLLYEDKRDVALTLSCQFENETTYIEADQVTRCIVNLVKNSVEAFEGGGEVNISFLNVSNFFTIKVADNGSGIPKEIITQLGREQVKSLKRHGSGLGLLQANDAAVAHGGCLNIDSPLEKGTSVTVTLGPITE